MTPGRSSAADVDAKPVSEIYIEFDEQQLTVRTDAPELAEFLLDEYSSMIVSRPTNSMGRLDIMSVVRASVFAVHGKSITPRPFRISLTR